MTPAILLALRNQMLSDRPYMGKSVGSLDLTPYITPQSSLRNRPYINPGKDREMAGLIEQPEYIPESDKPELDLSSPVVPDPSPQYWSDDPTAESGEIVPKRGVPEYQRLVELQRKAEGWVAAVKDPQTGKVYSGYSHKSAINSVPRGDGAWGRLEYEWDRATNNIGFLDKSGNFISRDEADKMLSIKTMEDRKDLLAGKNLVRLFHDWEDSELVSPEQLSKLSPKERKK